MKTMNRSSLFRSRPFISYAREDSAAACRLREDLLQRRIEPWMDQFNLLGGQDFDAEIRRALRDCTHFVALVSRHSISKRGYVQKELREAFRLLEEFPPGEVFVIPVRLDNSTPKDERLRRLHWVDLFPDYNAGLKRLMLSIGVTSGDETAASVRSDARNYANLPVTICGNCKREYESQGSIAMCPHCHTRQYD